MDEKYIQELYDQLGGKDKFGEYNDFRDLISSNTDYQKAFHDEYGEKTLGAFNDFQSLVKKKDSTPLPYTSLETLPGQVDFSQPVSSGAQPISEKLVTATPSPSPEQLIINGNIPEPKPTSSAITLNQPQENLHDIALKENGGKGIENLFTGLFDLGRKFISVLAHDTPANIQQNEAINQKTDFIDELIRKEPHKYGVANEFASDETRRKFAESVADKEYPGWRNGGDVLTKEGKVVKVGPSFTQAAINKKVAHLEKAKKSQEAANKFLGDYSGLKAIPKTWEEAKEKGSAGIASYIGGAFGNGLGYIPTSIGTLGTSSYLMEKGGAYEEAVAAIAKHEGITENEVIEKNLDQPAKEVAHVVGLINGALDLGSSIFTTSKALSVGVKNIIKKKATEELLKHAPEAMWKKGAKALAEPLTEYATEFMQGTNSQIGALLAAGKKPEDIDWEKDIDWDRSREEGLQGLIGSAGIIAGSHAVNALKGEKNITAPEGDLGKPQANEKPKEQAGEVVSKPLPEDIQKESVPVQAEPKEQKEVANELTGKAVTEEVREPVQQPKEESKQPASEEGVQQGEGSFELFENEGEWKVTTKTYNDREIGNLVHDFLDKKSLKEYNAIRNKVDGVFGTKDEAQKNLDLLLDFENKHREEFNKAKEVIDSINNKANAIQEPSTSSVLQHPQEGVGEPRSERERVEPSEQGNEISSENQSEKEEGGGSTETTLGDNTEEKIKGKVKSKQLRPLAELESELDDLKSKREQWLKQKKDKYDPEAFADLEKQISDWEQAVSDSKKGKTTQEEVEYEKPTIKEIADENKGKIIIAKPSHGETETSGKSNEVRGANVEGNKKKYFIDVAKLRDNGKVENIKEEIEGKPVKKYPSLKLFSHSDPNRTFGGMKVGGYAISDEDSGFQVVSGKTIQEAKEKLDELVDQYGGEDEFKKVMAEQIAKRIKNRKAEEETKEETFGKGFKVIGTNLEGDKVGEDNNGVRAVLSGNGIIRSQPVHIIPGSGYHSGTPEGEFLTKEEAKSQAQELAAKHGFESPSHLLNSVKKRTGDTYENVQDIPKDVIEKVRNERELEQLTPKENEQSGTVANEGGAGTSSNPSELNAGEQTGTAQPRETTGSQKANGNIGGISGNEPGKLPEVGNETRGSTTGGDQGRLRPELKDAEVQHNFSYPENWERNKNKTFSKKQAYTDNIAALEIINSLLDTDSFATDEQKEKLSRYNGLGPLGEILLPENKLAAEWKQSNLEFYEDAQKIRELLKQIGQKTGTKPLATAESSTRNAYYTSLPVIRAIYEGLKAGGFEGGKILEGSVGSGRFIGGMPSMMMGNSRIKGVDMDVVSALISKYLYPKTSIANSPLQSTSIPSNYYDLFVSNIPFGNSKVYDAQLDKRGGLWKQAQDKLHTYFFAKAIDSVRPGGYVAILTTSNILDTPGNQPTRDLINKETDFVGAVRLSSSAFNSDAGTQVVTDIILLRKKLVPSTEVGESEISKIATQVVPHKDSGHAPQEIQYNEYFKKHPEQIFGTEFKAGGLYTKEKGYTLVGEFDPVKVGEKLAELAKKKPILERQVQDKDALQTLQISSLGRMVSGGLIEKGGKYYHVEDFDKETGKYTIAEIGRGVMPAEKDMPILKAFVETKNLYFDVLAKDKRGEDASEERAKLKKALKNLIKVIKPQDFNSFARGNKAVNRLLVQDPDFYAVSALEKSDGKFSDVVENPLPTELREFKNTDIPQEAIGYSINNYGKINLPFIQKVLGLKSEKATIEKILPEIFETPDEVVDKNEYLSGNVIEKLKQAEQWVKVDDKYQRNVEELKKVIPEPIPKHQITFQLGASWIPVTYTQQFLDSVFGEGRVMVRHNKITDDYDVEARVIGGDYEALGDGETRGVDVVVKAAITKNVPDFYKTMSDGTKVPLPKLTQDVRDKAEKLQDQFAGLIEVDEKMGEELSKIYNELFNGIVLRKFNGNHLTFPTMQGLSLNPHQKDAIMMNIIKQGGMIDHIVGAGKTIVMGVGAIKMKQIGLVNKPMVTTMKSVAPGFLEQISKQYPEAKILAPTTKDFAPTNRQRLFAQIANNDWDLVIITHDHLAKIPLPSEFEKQYIENEIEEMISARDEMSEDKSDKWAIKQAKALQNAIDNLQARLQKLQDRGENVSRTDFGTMGIDMLYVDESQQFKNLRYASKLRNVAGLGTAKGSDRASNLKMVCRYLQNMHGGDKGIVFASGTPISNSLVELYNIFQYLRPSLLKKLQMTSLDQFLKNFALITSLMEKNVAGVIKNKTRLSKFVNVQELAYMYSEISDIRGEHNLQLEKPGIKGGKPEITLVPQSETVKMITKAIYDASKNGDPAPLQRIGIHPKGDAKKALGLVLTTIGTKASIDPRLVFPGTKADGGKLPAVAASIKKIYDETDSKKGVQLVFADLGVPKDKNAKLGDRVKDQVIEMYGEEAINEIEGMDQVWKQHSVDVIKKQLEDKLEIEPEQAQFIIDEANDVNSFNVYDALKNLLIKEGIPENEIAFIHEAPTERKKDELFSKVKKGDVRIMLGSTMKMGTGVNVQNKVVHMHHIDVGWRPSDLEQRNGRGIRRGNENKEVGITYYGTEDTIDAYRFGLLATKQQGIDTFRAGAKGVREMNFEDGESMTLSEFAAAISGDTRMLDLEKLKSKAEKLKSRIESVKRANALRAKRIQTAKEQVEYSRNEREIVNDIAKRIRDNTKLQEVEEEEKDEKGKVKKVKKVIALFKGEVDGKDFDTKDPKQREEFYKLLSENANQASRYGYRERIGSMGGIDIYVKNLRTKDNAMRVDLGEDTVANDYAPVNLIQKTTTVTPVTIRSAISGTIRNIDIDIELSNKAYKSALSNLANNEATKESNIKEEDVKELEATEEKRNKLNTELKAEAEKQSQEPVKPEGGEEENKNSLEEIISENSKKNAEEGYEGFSGAMSTGLPIKPVGKVKKAPSDNALLALLAQNGLSREQLENELKEQVKVGDQEVDERIAAAEQPAPENMVNRWGEAITGVKNWATQHFKYLNSKAWPREANILREFETLFPWAKGNATQYVKTLVDGMTPNQYKVFSMRIILADMLESIDKGLNMVGIDGKLPFGFKDRDQVDRALTKYDIFMKADPRIQRAFDMREEFMKAFKDQLIQSGLLDENDIESYYHRRVLEYHAESEGHKSVLFGKDIADKKRDFQKRRKGTRGLDYSTNFLETEWKVVSEGLYEMEKQKILKDLVAPFEAKLKELEKGFNEEFDKNLADVKKQFGEYSEEAKRYKQGKRSLKRNYLYEHLPEGYSFYRVSDENRLFWAKTVTQKNLDRAIEQAEDNDNSGLSDALTIVDELIGSLKSGLMVGPKRKQYMIPTQLAEQLEELARNETVSAPTNLATQITSAWKQLMILSPTRLLRYNLNNTGSDVDRLVQVEPKILKYAKESTSELWNYLKTGETTPQLLEAMRGDVINSGFQISELADVSKEKWAQSLLSKDATIENILGKEGLKKLAIKVKDAPGNLWEKYMSAVSPYVQFRENILRYAAYKLASEKTAKGETFYWASDANAIRQIKDERQKNAKLARDVFGDYMNLSQGAHQMRRVLLPFYSWFEVNMKTHYNLLKNASSPKAQKEMIKSAVLRGIPSVAFRMAKAYVMMGLFTAAVEAWNKFAFGLYGGDDDTEKKLRESKIKGMQLIVGVSDDGKIRAIPIQGAFYDFIDFFGLWTIGDDIERIFTGDDKLKEAGNTAKGVGENMANKGAQLLTPLVKSPLELASGQSYYPNIFNPTPINDKWEYMFKSMTLGDEYNYLLSDKPKRESYLNRKFNNSLLREFDTEQLSYYAAKKIISDYEGSDTGGTKGEVENPTRASEKDAEYKFMLALRYGNYEEADKWLEMYIETGGNMKKIHQKIKSADPFKGVKKTVVLGEPVSEWYDLHEILADPEGYKPQTHFGRQLTSEDKFTLKEAMKYYERLRGNKEKFLDKSKVLN